MPSPRAPAALLRSWPERLKGIGDTLQRHNPHLIGIQELVTDDNVHQLLEYLPNHDAIWANGTVVGGFFVNYPDAAILYDRTVFDVLDKGWYWLSETPDRPSIGWTLSLFRIVIWARMRDRRSGTEFVFISTHFDNNGANKVPSANLFMNRTGAWVTEHNLPVIVTGDFNSELDSDSYRILTEGTGDGFKLTNTYHMAASPRFERNSDLPEHCGCPGSDVQWDNCLIDHVFVAGPPGVTWRTTDWLVDVWQYLDGEPYFPSDHRAYVATVSF